MKRRGAMGRGPKLERVSAGVYRNRQGDLVQRANRGRRATINRNAAPITGGEKSAEMFGNGQMVQNQLENLTSKPAFIPQPGQQMPQMVQDLLTQIPGGAIEKPIYRDPGLQQMPQMVQHFLAQNSGVAVKKPIYGDPGLQSMPPMQNPGFQPFPGAQAGPAMLGFRQPLPPWMQAQLQGMNGQSLGQIAQQYAPAMAQSAQMPPMQNPTFQQPNPGQMDFYQMMQNRGFRR